MKMKNYFPVHLNMEEASIIAAKRMGAQISLYSNFNTEEDAEQFVEHVSFIGSVHKVEDSQTGFYSVCSSDKQIQVMTAYKKPLRRQAKSGKQINLSALYQN